MEAGSPLDRGTKRPHDDVDSPNQQPSLRHAHYDAATDPDDVQLEITTGEGETMKVVLAATETIVRVKEEVERELGVAPRDAHLFSTNEAFEEELTSEAVGMLRAWKREKVLLSLMVLHADAQQVVPELTTKAGVILGDGNRGDGDQQLWSPIGTAFVPAYPDWLVTTEIKGNRVKISNIRTSAMVCIFGQRGRAKGQFYCPWGVAVTADSSFVIVADSINGRLQMLRLVVSADGSSARLYFFRFIGNGRGSGCGKLNLPSSIALLRGERGQETVLVSELRNHRVSQFALDGTFIRIFVGTGKAGSVDGALKCPLGITVLGSSGEVAIADRDNHRVQIFDSDGNYKRKFGSEGKDSDGQFNLPSSIVSDAHGNLLVLDYTNCLQVFSPEGRHLCSRNDLGLGNSIKGIAWSADGGLAVATGQLNTCVAWATEAIAAK
jgi:DNA-binding beta-propeller fold protein YncE